MKRSGQLITLALCLFVGLSGCTKISLTGGKVGGTGGGNSDPVLNPKAPPTINGDWRVSYIYQDQAYDSLVTFAQSGKALSGKGEDNAGPFIIMSGAVDGNKVKFVKKYAMADPSKPSVEYSGDLEWEDDQDYRGWRMGGHYKAGLADGTVIDDKWVAISLVAEQATQAAQQAAANPPPQPAPRPNEQPQPNGQTQNQGGAPHLSGMYKAQYNYNFKRITSKLWLIQDEHNVSGHGVDTNTNEKFHVTKGWYHYPKLTIICRYIKGQGAAANREMKVQAQVNAGPSLRGETSLGGSWEASIVR